MGDAPRLLTKLAESESLRLLGSISLGRVVFTIDALPAIRLVNHVVDDGAIIIRSHEGAAIVAAANAAEGVVIAYEADTIDPDDHLGWSVIVTELARLITDPAEIARFQAVMCPWGAGQMDYVIRITPQIVTGFRLTSAEGTNPDDSQRS